ncbi:MAG TPA: PD-(D/E)XK nuclease family protein [Candidatus Obscuribacterales bacterium]
MPVAFKGGCSAIELLVGPYRSGKTSHLLELLVSQARSMPLSNILLVVPSARYRSLVEERLRRLLVAELSSGRPQAGGIFGIRIMPFYEACRLILECAGQSANIVPDGARTRLVADAMESMLGRGELKALAPIACLAGTSAAVLELIDEFQRAGLSPEDVRLRLEQTAAAESRYLELARIYQEYWRALDRIGYHDRRRLAFAAREILFQGNLARAGGGGFEYGAAPTLSFSLLAVDGFDRISRLQAQVILGMSRLSQQTKVVFDYQLGVEACPVEDEYLWKQSSYEELVRTLRIETPVPFVGTAVGGDAGSPPADSLARQPAQRKIFSALDRFLEMQEIARLCKQCIVRQGLSPADVLVVARDLKAYRGAVEAAFAEAGIPCFVDESVSLLELPIVQFVVGLVTLYQRDFARADVLSLLRSPYLRLVELGLERADVEDIDRQSFALNIVGGRQQWEDAFGDSSRRRISTGLSRLFDLAAPAADVATLTDFSSWVERLLDKLLFLPHDTDDGTDRQIEDRSALAALREVVRNLVLEDALIEQRKLPFETLVRRFETLVVAGNYRRHRQWSEAVTICGADLAPNKMYQAVFVAGMVEGEFPRRGGQSGFVSREELARWSAFGLDIGNPRHHPGFEWALFTALVKRAGTMICLSFPVYEMNGDETVPSFFVAEEVSSGLAPLSIPYRSSMREPVSVRDAVAGRLWNFPASTCAPVFPALRHPQIEEFAASLAAPLAVAHGRLCGPRDTLYNGCLTEFVDTGVASVSLPARWSVSRLNYYGQCPFKYWVSYVLGMEPRLQPGAGLPVDLLGSTYHRALELFYTGLAGRGLSLRGLDDRTCLDAMTAAADAALAELESRREFRPGEFWAYEKQEIYFRLQRFAREELARAASDERSFEPAHFELRFGEDKPGSLPPLAIETSAGQVVIRGVVDRIDVADEGRQVRIVDYKSGSKSIKLEDALSGRNLQIPVYALAVERAVLPGSHVAAGLYLSVNSGEVSGRLDFEGSQGEQLRARTEELIERFVSSICQGDFTVRPTDQSLCAACQHKKVCRIAELKHEEWTDESAD